MARTALASQTLPGPTGDISAGGLDRVLAAGDTGDGNTTPFVGNRMLVVARNSDATNPYTFTMTSAPDEYGRSSDVTAYSLAAGDIAMRIVDRRGWQQSDGALYMAVENVAVLLGVFQID